MLRDFCYRNNPIPRLLQEVKLDRREQKQVPVQGAIAVRVLDNAGNPVSRPFKGEIQDFSSGGMAFSNYFKKGNTAQSLLGRRIALMCKLSVEGSWRDVKKLGRVVGVQLLPFSEYSFHVRFERPVPSKFVASLDPASSSGKSPDLEVEV